MSDLRTDDELSQREQDLLKAGLAMATGLEEYIGACGNRSPEYSMCPSCWLANEALHKWSAVVVRFRS